MKRLAFAVIVAVTAWGCDSGPSGPGQLIASLDPTIQPLGGAVLEVVGKGIEGFGESGSTRVFSAPMSQANAYRVVLVSDMPGTLEFRVSVQDLAANSPTAAVVNVVNGENMALPATSDYKIRFSRK
jgi:hypothetical protein